MKINSLFIAALVVVCSVVSVAGKDEPRKTGLAVVSVKGSEVFKVIYKGATTGKVKLNIYNESGEVIFTEIVSGLDGFIYPFNFTGLNSGVYTIELTDAAGKKVEKVNYQPVKNVNNVRVTKISKEDNKFLVSIANTIGESINVKIYDDKFNLLHTENRSITGDVAWVYKMASPSSSYTFEVSDKAGNTKTVSF